jgi:murein DD-endopeptidase MepM/ murein hydrolase activator NlpD
MADIPSPHNWAERFSRTLSAWLRQYAVHFALLVVVGGAIWFTRSDLLDRLPTVVDVSQLVIQATAEPEIAATAIGEAATAASASSPSIAPESSPDLVRQTDLHTNIPTRPRKDVITYTVQSGDTLFGIAEKYGLKPETLVWGNPILKDDPHLLRPGQNLRIAPVDGVLHDVVESNTLNGLAIAFGVTPDDIIGWPGNDIDPEDPKITPGQLLIVPGGHRAFVQFVIPQISKVKRSALPADAGPGQCPGGYSGGATGSGFFIWPANNHYLSGNNYWAGHQGIDIAAGLGAPIYAADSGVAVFAGWSNWGYGNMVVIDHGNGWNTLYAHLSQWNVSCGESLNKGYIVGLAGNTGNSSGAHLHFEMNYQGVRPNPWNYLPAP